MVSRAFSTAPVSEEGRSVARVSMQTARPRDTLKLNVTPQSALVMR